MERKLLNRIKVVLAEKNKSNKWLSEQLDKDPAIISKWVTNTTQPRTGGRDDRILAVFSRRRADRLGRERPSERDPYGLQGARAAGGRDDAPDGRDPRREPRPHGGARIAEQ